VPQDPLRTGLLQIYGDLAVDIAAAGPICDLSGRCCRFKEFGHTLFVSRTEAELLLEDGLPENAVIDESGCPFQIGNLCTARERRPLGCRVFYCDPRYAGQGEALSERYVARLKRLHDETGSAWEYRPLHHFLREADTALPDVRTTP
jgi:Fe-S-cluster containining protein